MTLERVLILYLTLQATVALAGLSSWGLGAAAARWPRRWPARAVRLGQLALLGLALAGPLFFVSGLEPAPFTPLRRMAGALADAGRPVSRAVAEVAAQKPVGAGERNSNRRAAGLALLLLGMGAGAGFLIRDGGRLRKILGGAFRLRRIGRVEILISDEVTVPFACRTWRRALVVIPGDMVPDRSSLSLAVRHELEHHRQGDTLWVWILAVLRPLFFWNPLLRLWEREFSRVQEFCCDRVLVTQRNVSPLAYGSCLLTVASAVAGMRRLPVGTTGMARSGAGLSLERRIRNMMEIHRNQARPILVVLAVMAMLVPMAVLARAAAALPALAAERVQRLAVDDASEGAVLTDVNPQVLQALEVYRNNGEVRRRFQEGVGRLAAFRATHDAALASRGLPQDLWAVLVVESNVQNLPEADTVLKSAGMWQFIPQTARSMGLTVEAGRDERLDPDRATTAALDHLNGLYSTLGDWRLAILAYNAGKVRVQTGIDAVGSRNPWQIIGAGYQGDEGYLPRVVAVSMLLRHPELLD